MSVFKPNSNKDQDIGGVFGEPAKNPQSFDSADIPVKGLDNTYPDYQCGDCSDSISTIYTSGCLQGSGTEAAPLYTLLAPNGGISCTSSGLSIEGSGCGFAWSFESGSCPSSPSEPADPVGTAVQGTLQLEVFPSCINFWYYNGATWELRDTFNALEYSGDGSGVDCVNMTTIASTQTGAGTFADPYTACDLDITQPCDSDINLDNRATIYFELGQGGFLVADGAIATQDRWVVPEGYELEITKAQWTLGASGTTNTEVEFYSTQGVQAGTAPTPSGAPDFTLTVPSGLVYGTIPSLEGAYNNLVHIQERVETAGAGAKDLLIQVWARMCHVD